MTMRAELDDHAEQLLTAIDASAMMGAAKNLRTAALEMRRDLTRPSLRDSLLELDPTVPDPELRRRELADLAVDVVAATDYLLRLLAAAPTMPPRLILASDTPCEQGHGYADEEKFDRLVRRQLDARSTAVRLGMRLITELNGGAPGA